MSVAGRHVGLVVTAMPDLPVSSKMSFGNASPQMSRSIIYMTRFGFSFISDAKDLDVVLGWS